MAEISPPDSILRMTPSLARALSGGGVGVGTENPAKCSAVRDALTRLQARAPDAPDIEIRILASGVPSGVPEQPVGYEEIVSGARNRARAAFDRGGCVLAVGIEDGLVSLPGAGGEAFFNVGCAWVTDGERDGSGFSSGFVYPPECVAPATAGRAPIGELFDTLWRTHREPAAVDASGRNEGNIGKLTAGRLSRSDYGAQAVICALVPFLHRDLYA